MASYDFIIVGGGTAGLSVANRLSADPSQHVLVLEAGSDLIDDPRVRIPGSWGSLLGSEADWGFQTADQPALNGRPISVNQGKGLGGSSSINAQVFVPPTASVIDAWQTLGNPGWNWESLRPYYAKAFTSPPLVNETVAKELAIDGWKATAEPSSGPIQASFPGDLSHPVRRAWADTFAAIGFYMPEDPFLMPTVGSFSCLASVDAIKKERSHSGSAYYLPIKSRDNLHVITNATVQKILFEGGPKHGSPTAIGVQYSHDNELEVAHCKKEVLLAAGALQSPKILELSGIGNGDILRSHGIDTLVDLPGVGENLQDHIMSTTSFAAVDDLETIDSILRQNQPALDQAINEFTVNHTGPLTSMGVSTMAYLPVMQYLSGEGRKTLEDLLANNWPSDGTQYAQARARAYYKIAERTLLDPKEPSSAFLSYIAQNTGVNANNTKSLSFNAILSHPLSRGSVHISSARVSDAPVVDPKYLSNPVDFEVFANHVFYLETIAASPPLTKLLKHPLVHRVPESDLVDLDAAKKWMKENAVSMWHLGGSCSMLPRELDGVVDPKLCVYGAKNLRIIDSSVIPLISTGNIQTTVYAVAERAADLIKEAWNAK
ncbi:putative GMC oxidoreductase [Xylariomycetidae sp. FL2044]|nr:putative GMC oxidoreductase [Xylariomycetidae sp. FL2044]